MNTRNMLNDPFFIGFETLFDRLGKIEQKPVSNYPPYNIIKMSDDSYIIELALAGFNENDLNVVLHDGNLTISANVGDPEDDTQYLHKGIAARSFVRKFTLADTIEIENASLGNGMLRITLKNVIPEEKKPRKIPITTAEKQLLVE